MTTKGVSYSSLNFMIQAGDMSCVHDKIVLEKASELKVKKLDWTGLLYKHLKVLYDWAPVVLMKQISISSESCGLAV